MNPYLIAGLAGVGGVGGIINNAKKNKFYEEYARAMDEFNAGLKENKQTTEDQDMLMAAFNARAGEGGVRANMAGKQAAGDLSSATSEATANSRLFSSLRGQAQRGQGSAMASAGEAGVEVTGNLESALRVKSAQEAYARRLEALRRIAEQSAKAQRDKKRKWYAAAIEGAASGATAGIGM